ncbi:hypothetical protein WA158_005521 [Blastocystis sp. Blastoise]
MKFIIVLCLSLLATANLCGRYTDGCKDHNYKSNDIILYSNKDEVFYALSTISEVFTNVDCTGNHVFDVVEKYNTFLAKNNEAMITSVDKGIYIYDMNFTSSVLKCNISLESNQFYSFDNVSCEFIDWKYAVVSLQPNGNKDPVPVPISTCDSDILFNKNCYFFVDQTGCDVNVARIAWIIISILTVFILAICLLLFFILKNRAAHANDVIQPLNDVPKKIREVNSKIHIQKSIISV